MIRPFSILQSTRLSTYGLTFKKYIPLSLQYYRHLSTTTTTTTTTSAKNDSQHLCFRNVIPYHPDGTRASQQKNTRRTWTKEEDALLKNLYAQHGFKYSLISRQLGRSVPSVYHRCQCLFNPKYEAKARPWNKEELATLRTLVEQAMEEKSQQNEETPLIDWHIIQQRMPYPRELTHLKLTWYHSINPQYRRGRWTPDETNHLNQLVQQFGIKDWVNISLLLRTRSPRQCLEKYRHTMAPARKGRFTPQEDADLMNAINTYGDQDFLRIQQVLASPRTPRQLAKRYRYALDPAYDRSPWSDAEKREMYHLTLQWNRNMTKVKKHMNSKRHTNDMWNQFAIIHRSKSFKTKDEVEDSAYSSDLRQPHGKSSL